VRFSQVRLLVDDFPGCFRFLRDDLGLECSSGGEDEVYASFRAGEGAVAIFQRAGQAGVVDLRGQGDSALVVLEVDDVDAEATRLASLVVAGPVSRPDWGGRVAYLRDPDDNLFELFQSIPMDEE
jgi:catechol 2,3-dioxygenase-like lactoylglutathione lyase family enzyme